MSSPYWQQRAMSSYPEDVTCLVCLYQMGYYVPLSKLREHQAMQRRVNPCNYNFLAAWTPRAASWPLRR